MRRASALPIVLFSLALMSGLVVSGSFIAKQLSASGRASVRGDELEALAEEALIAAVAQWDSVARANQNIGSALPLTSERRSGASIDAWVTRLSERCYWMIAESSTAGSPVLRRRLGLIVRVGNSGPIPLPDRPWGQFP